MEEFKKYNFNGLNINSKGEYIMLTPEILGRPLREKEYEYNMLFASNSNVNSDVRINKNYQSLIMAENSNANQSAKSPCLSSTQNRLGSIPQPNVNVNVNVNFSEYFEKQSVQNTENKTDDKDVNIESVKFNKETNKIDIIETDGDTHTIDVDEISNNIQDKLEKENQTGCW